MTERHEMMHCVECIDDALSIVRYEVKAKPGHGPEFCKMLNEAIGDLEKARKLLRAAMNKCNVRN